MITINNVTYKHSKRSSFQLNNLSLQFETGLIHGLLGNNGAGKTTLLHLICGLHHSKQGEILLGHGESHNTSPNYLSQFFFVPDEVLLTQGSIADYTQIYTDFYPNFDQDYLERLANELTVSITHKFVEMSLGQRKKAYICLALATQTPILILDEPTNGLDIPSKSKLRKILSQHITEEKTILVSTHQVRDLGALLDSVSLLKNGDIIFQQNMVNISSRLYFPLVGETYNQNDVLYKESGIVKEDAILKNNSQQHSEVNLELLFNALNSDQVNEFNAAFSSN